MSEKKKSILLLIAYSVFLAILYILQDVNETFSISTGFFVFSIAVRVLIWNALKPIGPIHGNPFKYNCQKKGKLKEYKAGLEKTEKVLVVLACAYFIGGIVQAMLNGGLVC